MKPVRAFRFVNDSECAWIAGLVKDIVGTWSVRWLREPRLGAVGVEPADRRGEDVMVRAGLHWQGYRGKGADGVFLATGPVLARSFAAMAFGAAEEAGDPGAGSLAGEVFARAWEDLAARLLAPQGAEVQQGVASVTDNVPSDALARASGAAIATVAFGGRPLQMLLPEPLTRRLLAGRPRTARSRPTLADPRQAIGGARVRISVHAGEAELDIGQLQSLSPGDVVPLAASIHQPLEVAVEKQPTTVRAFLGRTEGRKAIQLASRQFDSTR